MGSSCLLDLAYCRLGFGQLMVFPGFSMNDMSWGRFTACHFPNLCTENDVMEGGQNKTQMTLVTRSDAQIHRQFWSVMMAVRSKAISKWETCDVNVRIYKARRLSFILNCVKLFYVVSIRNVQA